MTELHAADEWYVAINGVPVGPILVAEVRRKAALGSVTEDSLVWQEGLDEWRPVKTFPELAVTVREAARAGRSSLIPPVPPPRAKVPSSAERNSPSRARDHDVPLPQGNAPISSVQANADSPPVHAVTDLGLRRAEPIIAPTPASNSADPRPISVVSDPFKVLEQPTGRPIVSPSKAVAVPTSAPADAASRTSNVPVARLSHGTPWLAIAMVAAATAFGITTAIVVFLPRPAQPSADVTNHTSVAATSVAALPPSAAAPSEGTPDDAPSASTLSDSRRRPPAIQQPPRSTPVAAVTATATAQPRPIDTHLAQTQSLGAIPTDNASESMAPPSQCQSEGQVQQVIGLHQPAMRRTCWERSAGDKLAASVSVALTIGPDGSSQGVSVTGDDPSLAKCIENDVRSWHFAPMGCAQKTAFSLKFVRQ